MARRQIVLNPQNTFYAIKRFIGRNYAELSSEAKRVTYPIRKGEAGNIIIKCPRLNKNLPEEISAMVLRWQTMPKLPGRAVTGAVITVPLISMTPRGKRLGMQGGSLD